MPSAKSPVQYLAGASEISLETFELARLNRIANLRKELHQVMEEWIEAEVEARLARWIRENRGTGPRRRAAFPPPIHPVAIELPPSRSPKTLELASAAASHPIPPRLAPRKRFLGTRSACVRKIAECSR